jgi:acyl-CoA thioesterase FadM
MGNDRFLTITEEAYQRYLRHMGGNDSHFFGATSLIAAAQVQFLGQSFYGDELCVKLWLTERSNSTFRIVVQLATEKREIGRLQIDRVFFDPSIQKSIPCPADFIDYFEAQH